MIFLSDSKSKLSGRWCDYCCLILLLLVASESIIGQTATQPYGPHKQAATSETRSVPESSGVIAGRVNKDVYWTHNDSGIYSPAVWAFRLSDADMSSGTAQHLGSVLLKGARLADWEDIAAGPKNTIYILDGGDNPPCSRTDKTIYRFVEPAIKPSAKPIRLSIRCDKLRFEYPDPVNPSLPADDNAERYDAESLFVHPATGDIYMVTKRDNKRKAAARVYKVPAESIEWNTGKVHVLQFVADIASVIPNTPVAADIDAGGKRVVIRNYTTAFEFILPQGKPFEAIFQLKPVPISLLFEQQGEAICYSLKGGHLITTSEASISPNFKIYITPRLADKIPATTSKP